MFHCGQKSLQKWPRNTNVCCSSPSGWSLSRHCQRQSGLCHNIKCNKYISSSVFLILQWKIQFLVFCQYGILNKSYTEWCVIWLKNPHKHSHPWIPTQAFTLITIRWFSWLFTGSDNKMSNLISGSHDLKTLDKMLWVWHLFAIESERLVFHNGLFKKYK